MTSPAGPTSASTQDALPGWLGAFVVCAHDVRGAVAAMTAATADPGSALHASCVTMRAARTDVDGEDLFALAISSKWSPARS